MKNFKQFINEAKDEMFYYHGTPSGKLISSPYGIHVGTFKAAKQALEARIGVPAEGKWDGTRQYGKTLLAGKKRLKQIGPYLETGYNADAPEENYYPNGKALYGDRSPIALTEYPTIYKVQIIGPMTNTPYNPVQDSRANSMMKSFIQRNKARKGYYYKNDGEDYGSISAVVPNLSWIEIIKNEKL